MIDFEKSCKKINDKSTKISNGFFDNQRENIALILLIAFVSFFFMFLMNSSTPYVAEDFDYHYIFADDGRKITGERIESIADIVTSMKVHYHTMNGRIVTHSIVQFIMMIDKKPIFNVVNSIMYVIFSLLMYKHCIGKSKKQSVLIFLFVNLSVWLFVEQWGMTTVWLLGSVNYLWMSTFRLLYLLVFRLYAEDGEDKFSFLKAVAMLPLGFIAGNSSENMGAALVGVTVLFFIFYKIKKYKIKPWIFTAFIGLVSGYALMFFAPANRVRIAETEDKGFSFAQRLVSIPSNAILFLAPLVFVGIFLLILILNYKKEKNIGVPFIYFLGAFGATAVMFAISIFPSRAWFGIIVYLILSDGILLKQAIEIRKNIFRQATALFAVFCCVWTLMNYVKAYQSANEFMNCWNERIEYIEEQKAEGNYDLKFSHLQQMNKHAPLYSWTDIGRSENDPQHISIAQYFGLNSVDWDGNYIIIE